MIIGNYVKKQEQQRFRRVSRLRKKQLKRFWLKTLFPQRYNKQWHKFDVESIFVHIK